MMKNRRIAVSIVLILLGCSVALAAATRPKFRASGPAGAGIGHYVVTLNGDASADDLVAMKREVTVLYGAVLEVNPSAGVRQFAASMTPAHAKLLSSDPRVSEVAEAARTMPSAESTATPSSARRFATHTSGYGDNGQSGAYTYDSSGNITAIGADTFLYDAESRLTQAVIRGVTESYNYDAFGNRKSATGATNCLGQTICAQPVTVDKPTNRLLTVNGAAVHYDAPGNITNIDATSGSAATVYLYDGTEMMTESIVASDDRQYVYTADDERIAVKRGASWTWTVRDLSNKVLREFTSVETGPSFAMTSRAWAKDYVWRDGLLLATTTSTGTLHYHLDHLGTPRLITDANHLKVAEHAYYPFGAEINVAPHETSEEAMKFTGHERDTVAGDGHTLDYMHARFYNANLGRLLSFDPARNSTDQKRPQAWNRYTYALNNPVKLVDPNGEAPLDPALLQFFRAAFSGKEFSSVDVYNVKMPGAGLTLGNNIFLDSPNWDARNPQGLGLLAHELDHNVEQREGGIASFLERYDSDIAANQRSGMSFGNAYVNASSEQRARIVDNHVTAFLSDPKNRDIAFALQKGQPLNAQQLDRVKKDLAPVIRQQDAAVSVQCADADRANCRAVLDVLPVK